MWIGGPVLPPVPSRLPSEAKYGDEQQQHSQQEKQLAGVAKYQSQVFLQERQHRVSRGGSAGQVQEHVFEAGALQVEALRAVPATSAARITSASVPVWRSDEPHRTRLGAGHAASRQVLQVADQLVHRSVSLQLDGDLSRSGPSVRSWCLPRLSPVIHDVDAVAQLFDFLM